MRPEEEDKSEERGRGKEREREGGEREMVRMKFIWMNIVNLES